ncbi:MAG: hypothetical protein IKM54_05575 [Butyricicoccus sp.]|nr:hypothetical protein [Butyricicoccus sp.]
MLHLAPELLSILEKAGGRMPLTREELKYLLSQPADSYASGIIRSAASALIREKNGNAGIIIGQVGVDIHPCSANCKFCSFGEGHCCMPTIRLEKDAMMSAINGFRRHDDLYGMYLMTMADTPRDVVLDYVSYARQHTAPTTQIWVNTGDHSRSFYEELRAAGAQGAYHVCRLREGTDTQLDPKVRFRTMETIREAGLDLFSCCEPIGPEHTIDELVENIFLCIDLGVTQFGAMRRIAVPGSPLYHHGQISDLEMAHVMGCIGLVYASVDSCRFFGVHEPCQLGYLAGANFVTAETGANPRDTVLDTSKGRGWDMERCRKLLFECGFTSLLRGDESRITLDYDYLVKTDSLL